MLSFEVSVEVCSECDGRWVGFEVHVLRWHVFVNFLAALIFFLASGWLSLGRRSRMIRGASETMALSSMTPLVLPSW